MLRLCEITGLALTDFGEVMGFLMFVIIIGVFVGNVMTLLFRESFSFLMELVLFVSGHVKQYLVKKRRK